MRSRVQKKFTVIVISLALFLSLWIVLWNNKQQATFPGVVTVGSTTTTTNVDTHVPLSLEFCEHLNYLSNHHPITNTNTTTTSNYYYLNKYLLRQAGFIPGLVQPRWWQKIQNQERISFLTLGGSFTRGHGCGEVPLAPERECAWPSRLERWWNKHMMPTTTSSSSSSDWTHAAEHGSGSVQALQRLGILIRTIEPDVVILDFLVNDITLGESDSTIAHEKLIRTLMQMLPQVQIILLEAGCPACIANPNILLARRRVAQYYGIPIIDYASMVQLFNKYHEEDASGTDRLWPFTEPELDPPPFTKIGTVWPNFSPPVNVTQKTCCPLNHPPWPVHQYVADAVAYGMIELLRSGCASTLRDTFYEPEKLDRYRICLDPLTRHDAHLAWQENNGNNNNGRIVHPLLSAGWSLYEDRPGRPGWITNTTNSTITFPIKFGAQPTVAIAYLRSYESLGTARVSFTSKSGRTESVLLEGLWEKHFSLPDVAVFVGRPDGTAGNLLSPLEEDGYDSWREQWKAPGAVVEREYSIDISLISGQKFKILQVMSC